MLPTHDGWRTVTLTVARITELDTLAQAHLMSVLAIYPQVSLKYIKEPAGK